MIDILQHCKLYVIKWCYMCKKAGKTIGHKFLPCKCASELWSLLFCLFGVYCVMPQRVLDVLPYGKGSRRVISDVWRAIPLCLMWLIGKEYDGRARCRKAFDGIEAVVFRALHEWITVLPNHSSSILLAFIDSCSIS